MEKIVEELKKLFRFKETTSEGDIVVVVAEQIMYALVTSISPDASKKDEWWHVTLHFLTFPPQKATWTLREAQFSGREIFTMGGAPRYIRALDFTEKSEAAEEKPRPKPKEKGKGKKPVPLLRVVK